MRSVDIPNARCRSTSMQKIALSWFRKFAPITRVPGIVATTVSVARPAPLARNCMAALSNGLRHPQTTPRRLVRIPVDVGERAEAKEPEPREREEEIQFQREVIPHHVCLLSFGHQLRVRNLPDLIAHGARVVHRIDRSRRKPNDLSFSRRNHSDAL